MDPDLRQVRTLLARAFVHDPLMLWVFPEAEHRLEACAAWLALFVELDAACGHVDLLPPDVTGPAAPTDLLGGRAAPGPRAVAVWRLPGAPPAPALPSIGGLLAALVGTPHAREVGEGLAELRALVPAAPHAYLHLMAVDPALQGRGLGRAVLQPGLDRAERAGLPVHLETTSPNAVGFYRHLGLRPTGEARLGTGPRVWTFGTA